MLPFKQIFPLTRRDTYLAATKKGKNCPLSTGRHTTLNNTKRTQHTTSIASDNI